ncbi:MAG: Nif3-like dinuclear metal center hexameric protein [Nanoarchaeota archaeon]|nr:Nif3-like dinuclear metal center hexameric protein [Nanoarchaeota archaeon]
MNLDDIVIQIKKDWDVDKYPEDWNFIIETDDKLKAKATEQFLKENRGLIFKNSNEVKKIYLACFPSTQVLKEISKDSLLITHHPFDWNGIGMGFKTYSDEDYKIMEENGISLMFMHVSWDAVRNEKDRVSTGYGTAKILNMSVRGEFQEYHGALVSVYGALPLKTIDELVKYIQEKLGNNSLNVFRFGSNESGLVGLVPGGGNDVDMLQEAHKLGIRTYITGCTNKCQHPYSVSKSKEFLKKAKEYKINIIGASHYLTEKWAMQQSVSYFKKFNFPVKFIENIEQMKILD